MNKENLRFIWLDDDPKRKPSSTNMADALNVVVEFWSLEEKNLEAEIRDLVKEEEPDLIIIDQNLFEGEKGTIRKGSTVAAIIREEWDECPIVCVTNEDINRFSTQQRALFEDVYQFSSISEYYVQIKSIAESFRTIKANRPKETNDLIRLLSIPELDQDKLAAILPSQLKDNYDDASLVIEISRWVREILIARPGFLYNKLWLSTLIGIKEGSFHKVEERFVDAQYIGLFANEADPRWWKSKALEILYDLSGINGLPWEKGRGIEGLTEDDFSICYSSEEPFPETVAYTDQSSDAQEVPIKIRNTIVHPDFERILYFDDIRLMQQEE